jgi:hypothetical protein
MSAVDSHIAVAVDGAGKAVRNLVREEVQDDGTLIKVYSQVVTIADSRGDIVDFDDAEYKSAVLDRLDNIIVLLSQLVTE